MKEQRFAMIVAGGKGIRMGNSIPKQFLLLSGKPLLMRTMEAFIQADNDIKLILVLPESQQAYWEELTKKFNFQIPHPIALGGETRFESVKNGLAFVGDNSLVAVHDGVRPFIKADLIERCYVAAAQFGAVIPVTEITESIRRLEGETSFSVRRDTYRSVQTPQTFQSEILKNAYQIPYNESFTDDASVVEAAGYTVHMVEGSSENIKITTPLDLIMAEQWMKFNPDR